jgi:urea transport system substrate-binding protein
MNGARMLVPVGIVFSRTGSYAALGRDQHDGTLLAIETVNASPSFGVTLVPSFVDPAGSLDAYRSFCEQLLAGRRIRHVIGCYTSSSRKEIIPVIEKSDALLWYPSHYEGFESCDNVIYGGAAPNQHLIPAAAWMLPRYGHDIYCVGSNYVWPWENNRILREIARECGGRILREKYLPIGSTEVEGVIRDIRDLMPDFIFNTLIGESCYAFYRAYRRLGDADPRFRAERRPVLSCSLSEPELLAIGGEAASGNITSSVYFQSVDRAQNTDFICAFRARFGAHRVTSADAEAAYLTTLLLAMSLQAAGTDEVAAVKRAAYECRLEAPQGAVRIDPQNNHCWLTPRIGRASAGGQFALEWEADAPCRPDPYLAHLDARTALQGGRRPHLRLVGRFP